MAIPRDCPGVCFADQCAWDATKAFPGDRDDDSRYSPFASITGSGAGISTVTRNGKKRLRLFGDAAAAATVRYRYKFDGSGDEFDDRPTTFKFEIAGIELVYNAASLGTLDFVEWIVRDADDTTDISWLFRITSSNTVLRRNTGGTGLSSVNWSSGMTSATEYSIRGEYTASSSNAAANGTIKLWLATGDSLLNDANGTTTTWTAVVDTTHSGGKCNRPPTPLWTSSAAGINNVANNGCYTGAAGYYSALSTPVTATTGTQSWARIHRMQFEKATCWYRPSTGKIFARMTVRHLEELLPGTTQRDLHIRVFASEAHMAAGTPVAFSSTGGATAVTVDSEGYYRKTFDIDGLEPDTTYWYEVYSTLDSGSGSYVMRSGTGEAFEYAVLRTPARRGVRHTSAPRFYPDGCGNQHAGQGRDKHMVLARRIADAADTNRLHVHVPLGDLIGGGYMDEHQFDKSGTEDEGAQTRQAMANAASLVQHGFWMMALHSVAWCFPQGDDHDRTVNDAAMSELLADNVTNPWIKSGRPNPISSGSGEYTITPRALADLLLAHCQAWMYDAYLPATADAELLPYRYYPTANDFKYGSTAWDPEDLGWVYTDLGRIRLVMFDTRGTATNMNDNDTATLTGIANAWVENAIRDAHSSIKGIMYAVPGYVVGFNETGGTLKNGDIQYASNADVPALLNERTRLFRTLIQAASVNWGAIINSDHHFSSGTTKRVSLALAELGTKIRAQVADGGAYSISQDPANLGNGYATLYDHIDNYGQTIERTLVTYQIDNEDTGAATVTFESIDAGVNTEATLSVPGTSGGGVSSAAATISAPAATFRRFP